MICPKCELRRKEVKEGVEGEGKWRLAISGRVDSHQGEGWQELL